MNHERTETYFQHHLQLTGALEDAEFSVSLSFLIETMVPLKLGFLKYPVYTYLILYGVNVKQKLSIFVECLRLINIS